MLESNTPGGNVSWIRFSVLLEIQPLMVIRAFSGSACRSGPGLRVKGCPRHKARDLDP